MKATTAGQVNTTADGNALATASAYSGGRTAPALDATLVDGSAATTVANNGGNRPLSITDPFLGSRWCIALYGIYPSRS
ncbi:hypothetical protein RB2150_15381 [Rhodobacteraceae bacterium HTCC2150]|nr:hypothetical protein RB2150_15381 [Rhodobacteraceae bacterium HTCC2150]